LNKIFAVAVLGFVLVSNYQVLFKQPLKPNVVAYRAYYDKPMLGNNSYISISSPYYPKVETYGSLIDCMVNYESGGNENAIGDSGLAHGLLQFHAPTFERYCVERYGFGDDIWNPEIQKMCAAEMLENGLGYNWTAYPKCLN